MPSIFQEIADSYSTGDSKKKRRTGSSLFGDIADSYFSDDFEAKLKEYQIERAAKEEEPKKNPVISFVDSLLRPKVETPEISPADRTAMIKINTGAAREPVVKPTGNPAQLEKRKQEQFAKNAREVRITQQNNYLANGEPQGMIERGNIDLSNRPKVKNSDGSVSTVRSISVEMDGKVFLLPTVRKGLNRVMNDDEAINWFKRTGQHLGVFDSEAAAQKYADELHISQSDSTLAPYEPSGVTEKILNSLPNGQFRDKIVDVASVPENIVRALDAGSHDFVAGVANTGSLVERVITGKDKSYLFDPLRDAAERKAVKIGVVGDVLRNPLNQLAFTYARPIPEIAATLLPGAALTKVKWLAPVVSKFPGLIKMLPFSVVAGGHYAREAQQEGASNLQQLGYGVAGGALEGLTERYMFGNLEDVLAGGKRALTKSLINIPFEAGQEAGIDPLTGLAKKAIYKHDMPWYGEGGVVDPEQMKQDALAGAGTALLLGGGGMAVNSQVRKNNVVAKMHGELKDSLVQNGVAGNQVEAAALAGLMVEGSIEQSGGVNYTALRRVAEMKKEIASMRPVGDIQPETVEQINQVAQNLESMGVPAETVQQMVDESVANGLTVAGENLKETQAAPEPAQVEAAPEPVSNLANLLLESGLAMNSSSVERNVTQKQPLVIPEDQSVIEEPGGLVGQNTPQMERVVSEAPVEETKIPEQGSGNRQSLVGQIVDKYLSLGWEKPVAEKNAQLLADAIENNTYNDLLHPRNSKSRKIYEELTGKKLPKTIKGTKAIVEGATYEQSKKYRLALKNGETKTVNGYPVKAEGSQNTFFVHKLPSESKKGPIKWQVSEASTGVRATGAYPTRQAAEAAFQSIFKQHGAAKVDELVTKFPKLPNKETPGASGEGYGSTEATHSGPMRTRPETVAGDSENIISRPEEKINLPKGRSDTGGYSDIEPESTLLVSQEEIDRFVDDSFVNKQGNLLLSFKLVSDVTANEIQKETGLDVRGYVYRLSSESLRHIDNKHGAETSPVQVPITKDDLKKIPYIVDDFDTVKLEAEENGEKRLIFKKKTSDGHTFYVEVVSRKHKSLTFKTMWKIIPVRSDVNPKDSPGTDVQDVNVTSSSTSRKATPHRVNAVTKSNPDTFNAQDAVRMKPSVDDIIAQSEEKVNSSKEHSDTGGYADVESEYTKEEQSAKGQPKDKDVNSLAVEMPELLDLVRQINEGKLPLLKEKLGNALGKFSFRGEKGDIKLRRDIFIGERLGELTINPRKNYKSQVDAFKQGIFDQFGQEDIVFKRDGNKMIAYHRNPNLAIKVMAHEIGHLIDWLDEKTMSRGNLLGHLAALKSYMKHVLPERPGAPGELTEADRRRLRTEAAKLAAKEKQAEAEPQEPGMPTAEDIKGIWNDVAAKEKYPALYEYIAHLSGKEKAQVLKQALKGMVNLPGFDPSKRVNFKDWTTREKELYKKLIREELEKRRLFDLETITNELKNLTQIWKPFDDRRDPKYTRYRYSPEELYADAFSVLVNNPSLLKKTAPTFHRAFFNYLKARPNVKAVWDDIQNRIGDKAELLQQRLDKTYRNFTEGHENRRALNLRRKGTIKSVTDTLAAGLVDKNQGVLKHVRKYEKKGEYQAHLAERTRRELEETNYISAEAENYVYELGQKILKPLQEGNLTVDDLGVYMFHQRVIHERSDMANPEGYGEKTSKDELAALRIRLGETGYAKIEELAGEYRKLRETLIIPRVAQSRMFSKETVDMMMSRKHYARFSVQHYLDKTYGTGTTARIFKQVGTFSKIENPLVVTVLNDISMLRAAKINESKLATVAFLKEVNNDATAELLPGKNGELIPAGETNIIVPANTKFDGHLKKYVAAEPKDPRQALLQVMVDGEIHSFYVSKEIAKSYEYTPFEATRTMQVIGMVFGPLKSVLVSKNPLWMVRNVIRDLRTTYKNVPELKLRKNFGSFLKFYGQAYKEARKAVLKGERSEDLNEMYKNFMINPDRYYGAREEHSENDLERLANEFKLGIYDEKETETARNKLSAFYKAIPEWLEKRGRISEMTGKLAGYKFLKNKTDRSSADIAHMVRTRIGTPDVRRVGEWQQVTNSFFMFSNVNKEGVRAAVESYKEDPGAYVWKTVGTNIIPKAIMLAIGAGIMRHLGDDDDEWKRWADAIPDYDKRAYTILPIFGPRMTKDGKAVYFRMPEDYEGQMFGAIAHAIFKGKIFGQEGAVATALEQSPYEFPNSNPYVTVGYDLMAYFIWKQNPVDEYRGQNILPQKVYEAGGVDAALRMASYAWRNLGGSSLYASTGEQDENFWQWLMKFPPFNIPGAFVKISDRGVNEEYYEGSDKETREKARKSLDIEKRIKKDVKAHRGIPSREDSDNLYYKLLEAGIILEDESDNEFYRRRYLGYAGKVVDDSRLSLILRARSKADRARALFQAKKNLSPAQYEKLKEKLANLEIEIEEE
jgi:hypothetical protein